MSSEHHQRVSELFLKACDLPADERGEYLARQCADDCVRREVEALLAQDGAVSDFLDTPALRRSAAMEAVAAHPSPPPPERIGGYRVLGVIGEGGMGVVYRAAQDNPRRTVALKVIRPGVASASTLRRFEVEAEALGRLQHPGIAQIYEAGAFDTGQGAQPFFAMEFVDGQPLLEFAAAHKLSTRARLELLAQVCDAVEHAHRRGIVHRDLKPGNILVENGDELRMTNDESEAIRHSSFIARHSPKILDFGVARVTDSDVQTTTIATNVGQLIGTVPYMSPEQVAGDPSQIDSRSDVYALGVIGYELLTGRLPYDVSGKMIHEAARVIREDTPAPLSSINRVFRGDLETIFAKALEKDRSRRYQTATALGDDVRRFLSDAPIIARRPSALYQFRKFARRNRAPVAGIGGIFLALVLGVMGTSWGWRETLASRATLEQQRQELEQIVAFQGAMISSVETERLGRGVLEHLRAEIDRRMVAAGEDQAQIDAAVASLDSLTEGVNTTDLARSLLDQHVLRPTAEAIARQFPDQPGINGVLRLSVGNTYYALGMYEVALPHMEQAVATLRRTYGDDHADTLGAINNLGVLLRALGRFDEAERCDREVLDRRRRTLGEDDPSTLNSMNNLAVLLRVRGELEEAERLCRAALDGRRSALGADDPATLESMNNLAGVLRVRGDLAAAEALYRESLDGRRRVLGPDHPATLTTISNAATLLHELNRLDEAAPLHRELIESRRRTLGDDHPNTLRALNNYAHLLQLQGRLDDAEALHRTTLEGRRRLLGEDHPDVLVSLANLGKVLFLQGRVDEGEPLVREAHAAMRQKLGENHRHTKIAAETLAAIEATSEDDRVTR